MRRSRRRSVLKLATKKTSMLNRNEVSLMGSAVMVQRACMRSLQRKAHDDPARLAAPFRDVRSIPAR